MCRGRLVERVLGRGDTKASVLKGGESGPALVPGKPEQSLLMTAVGYQDADLKMPPDKKLSDRQIAEIYGLRWGIEVFYRTFKQTYARRKLRSHAAMNAACGPY